MKNALISLLLLSLTACITEQAPPPADTSMATTGTAPDVAWVEVTTSAGNFTLQLNGRAAPLTVAHFLKNVDSGFYVGTVFHRIIPGFMIQGGGYDEDFNLRETAQSVPNESGNGLANLRSTIAMRVRRTRILPTPSSTSMSSTTLPKTRTRQISIRSNTRLRVAGDTQSSAT